MHSFTLSQRYLLRDSKVSVIEIAPPWVRTELMNSGEEERAMPLDDFIAGAIEQLGTDANEILAGPAVSMRANPGPGEHAWVNEFNDTMAAGWEMGIQADVTARNMARLLRRLFRVVPIGAEGDIQDAWLSPEVR